MKTKIFLVLWLNMMIVATQAQKEISTNTRAQAVYAELGGNGLLLSLNYDVRFANVQNGFGARAGLGFIADPFGDATGVTIPVGLNYLIGNNRNFCEVGAGATFYSLKGTSLFDVDVNESSILFIPSIGYRYQSASKGFIGRVAITPIVAKGGSAFWVGISAGYKF